MNNLLAKSNVCTTQYRTKNDFHNRGLDNQCFLLKMRICADFLSTSANIDVWILNLVTRNREIDKHLSILMWVYLSQYVIEMVYLKYGENSIVIYNWKDVYLHSKDHFYRRKIIKILLPICFSYQIYIIFILTIKAKFALIHWNKHFDKPINCKTV